MAGDCRAESSRLTAATGVAKATGPWPRFANEAFTGAGLAAPPLAVSCAAGPADGPAWGAGEP